METTSSTTSGGAGQEADRLLHDPDRDRYELLRGQQVLAVLGYVDEEAPGPPPARRIRDLRSTIVDPEHTGDGLGSALVRFALDDIRASGLHVVATCWFAAGWIARHEEYADLLASSAGTTAGDEGPGPDEGTAP
ncbi:GNAT family N-acetyltransferase [Brachybacterium hainanense]|uniref:GNAT family N-acetyltransferase n=1 Tax=Brachybacterium hainanense TaxID=1541174 RepID=A0ABV6RAV1_9MICO